ncbi:MAG: glutathione peroxidase [Planctomycetes bacterium]|nr:glutathione peroxidase [Planctomycetota bacterium]
MKLKHLAALPALVAAAACGSPKPAVLTIDPGVTSLYDMSTTTLEGAPFDLSAYRGRVALVVNVASRCGLTPQYEGLEQLYEEFEPRGFVLLAFPSNDFLGQEPGNAEEIRTFCTDEYGVTFPMFSKRPVTGEAMDEVYQFLTKEQDAPSWNFTKYLVDRDGKVLRRFGPRTAPDDAELRAAIEAALDA